MRLFLFIFLNIICGISLYGQNECTISYYGGKFHGRYTASGEIFNKNEMTCAHKTLPFGTIVEMTAIRTGKSILVRVNDRGPFIKGREFDVSEAAAKILEIDGIGKVTYKILEYGINKIIKSHYQWYSKSNIKVPKDNKNNFNEHITEIKYPLLYDGKYTIYFFKDHNCPFLHDGFYKITDLC